MQAWANPKGVTVLTRYNITVMWLGESHSRSKNFGHKSDYPEWLLCSFLPSLQAPATLVPQIMPHSLLLTSFSVRFFHWMHLPQCPPLQCTFNKHNNTYFVHITIHQNADNKSIRNKFEGQDVEDQTDGTKTITNVYHYFMHLPRYCLTN